ncbi:putative negative regulator of RcsB-dependent stress response [Bradyrhizobium japonicum]
MKRILIGLIAAAVLAAGGWFGFNLYTQHRATAEVEAAFEQIRASGGKASHGKVAFELATRTLTIENINVEPAQPELARLIRERAPERLASVV